MQPLCFLSAKKRASIRGADFKSSAGCFGSLLDICRKSVFGGDLEKAASNCSRQLREDSFQIIPSMTFEIGSFDYSERVF